MRISAKGRYALAAMISMAEDYNSGEYITVISISEKLGISKIYLEQVFSLLKRGGIVNSVKGAQGGYQLTQMPQKITVFDVLSAVELSLFEPAEETVPDKAPEIEAAMRMCVFDALDNAVLKALKQITLYDLLTEAEKHKKDQGYMFFI
ncbi:transcriptional regulator [Clostridium thermosuccinogenes]|jgi:Rrf2 family protein|uniref:Transcriptional regulator n=1 Tax=Clostridium thermosuccinogenes TaxID=84032 RepID=A0A2K2F677_9CLOT|nr:Rrf2 family transcriptional regulator [Pseudoclostridium thermosuccinogenes]AUS97996.1 transcriptional regulator [Pseudoclostridium thermosuccinogenes]PNT94287.1 transcriptional regulator [Pseudoclostridium thermosuccinogenes]PNU00294.1 transcriptional regulator [Pseudoclostridium thermosuccinogenes]PNU01618.1 transcriptional regulator [Pseudoclostridium thermosuccinogenes]